MYNVNLRDTGLGLEELSHKFYFAVHLNELKTTANKLNNKNPIKMNTLLC